MTVARRTAQYLCVVNQDCYSVINLETSSMLPLMPPSQDSSVTTKPLIVVTGPSEFLILSWTGKNTLGLFISGEGDPVRGTLEWETYPESVCAYDVHVLARTS
jgi:vacuolar protein sorting-associated protein 3